MAVRLGIDLKNEGGSHQLSTAEILECATLAERLGFESVWLNEDVGYDSLALLSALATQTHTLGLGTAIVNVYNRSPMQIAMGAATVDELSGGRLTLGLSVGHHPWNDLAHGTSLEAPVSRIRESVEFVRQALSGRPFTYDGQFFSGVRTQLGVRPVRDHLPVYIGGERPRMIEAAAATADGLLINVVPFDYLATVAVPRFHQAAREAGRDPAGLDVMAIVTCSYTDDPAEARRLSREAFVGRLRGDPEKRLATIPPRFKEEVLRLATLVRQGDVRRAIDEADDDLVSQFTVAGTVTEIRAALERYVAAGCTRLAVASYPRDSASVQRLLEALSPA